MKTTNCWHLPEAYYRACTEDQEGHVRDPQVFYPTELLKPVRMAVLERLHGDEIEQDCSEMNALVLGTAVHHLLEGKCPEGCRAEVKYVKEIPDTSLKLSGRIDLIDDKAGIIVDWKTTTCSHITGGDFTDWYRQGLMYAWLVGDPNIKGVRFIALIKDWSKSGKATADKMCKDYPMSGVYVYEFTFDKSDLDYIESEIRYRAQTISDCVDKGTDIPECSDEERYHRDDRYAVIKKGGIRATKVFEDRGDAEEFAKTDEKFEVVKREGEDVRCNMYCPVAQWCVRGKEKKNA